MSKADIISNIDKIIGDNSEVTDDTHMDLVDEISDYVDKVNKELIEALELISEGKGSYDTDPLKHCGNAVRDMIELANKALGRTTKN